MSKLLVLILKTVFISAQWSSARYYHKYDGFPKPPHPPSLPKYYYPPKPPSYIHSNKYENYQFPLGGGPPHSIGRPNQPFQSKSPPLPIYHRYPTSRPLGSSAIPWKNLANTPPSALLPSQLKKEVLYTSSSPTHESTYYLQGDDDKGPIRTIPAPNLNPADKPPNFEKSVYELHYKQPDDSSPLVFNYPTNSITAPEESNKFNIADDFLTHALPAQQNDFSTHEFPAQQNDFSTHALPAQQNDFSTHALPAQQNDFSLHALPAQQNDFSTHSLPAQQNDFSAHSLPGQQHDFSTHSLPAQQNDFSTHSLPAQQHDFSVHALPAQQHDFSTHGLPAQQNDLSMHVLPAQQQQQQPYYAPDPDPSLPSHKVPPTTDPQSIPSEISQVPLDIAFQRQMEKQSADQSDTLTAQELFTLLNGLHTQEGLNTFSQPPQLQQHYLQQASIQHPSVSPLYDINSLMLQQQQQQQQQHHQQPTMQHYPQFQTFNYEEKTHQGPYGTNNFPALSAININKMKSEDLSVASSSHIEQHRPIFSPEQKSSPVDTDENYSNTDGKPYWTNPDNIAENEAIDNNRVDNQFTKEKQWKSTDNSPSYFSGFSNNSLNSLTPVLVPAEKYNINSVVTNEQILNNNKNNSSSNYNYTTNVQDDYNNNGKHDMQSTTIKPYVVEAISGFGNVYQEPTSNYNKLRKAPNSSDDNVQIQKSLSVFETSYSGNKNLDYDYPATQQAENFNSDFDQNENQEILQGSETLNSPLLRNGHKAHKRDGYTNSILQFGMKMNPRQI